MLQPNQNAINIDLKNATQMKCACGSDHFIGAFKLFKVSAIASPNGQEIVVPMAVFLCSACNKILQ